jgi:hypothetical protein
LWQDPNHQYKEYSGAFFRNLAFVGQKLQKTFKNEILNRDLEAFSKAYSSANFQHKFSVYTLYESSKLV